MTWAEIITEIKTGMEFYKYKRAEGLYDLEEDSDVPSSSIDYKYTIRMLGLGSEDIRTSNIGGYLIELKVGYVTQTNTKYDTAMGAFTDLIVAITGASYFDEWIDFSDDPSIEIQEQTHRVVGTINMIYGIKGCP